MPFARSSAYKVLALQVERCLPRPYASLSAFRAKGRRVVPVAGLMAKIRKWLGLGKKP